MDDKGSGWNDEQNGMEVGGVYVEGPGCLVSPWLQNHKHGIGIYYCNITCICI